MLIDRIVGNTDTNFVSYGSRYIPEVREERKRGSGERNRKSRQIMEIPRKKL